MQQVELPLDKLIDSIDAEIAQLDADKHYTDRLWYLLCLLDKLESLYLRVND